VPTDEFHAEEKNRMKTFRTNRSFLIACSALVLSASVSSAAVIATESFAYSAGALSGQGTASDGWSGAWTGSPANVGTPGLTYTEGGNVLGVATTGRAESLGTSGNFRSLTASEGGGTSTVYVSFIARASGYGYWGLSLFDGNNERMFLGAPFSSTQATTWGFERASSDVGPSGIVGSGISTSTQAFLVYRMDFSGGDVTTTLYVNPTLAIEPGTGAANATRVGFTFNNIRLAGGAPGGSGEIDEIRIGTTWADVTPAVPIPEPASIAALGMLGTLMLLRRGA
jgi:hypothetical protein